MLENTYFTLFSDFKSKMFDVGDLPVLTFDNCVLKSGVIKWPRKLCVCFYVFSFFQNPKNDFLLSF